MPNCSRRARSVTSPVRTMRSVVRRRGTSRGHEYDAEPVAREHHGHFDATGQLRQPFGVARKRETGQVEGMLLRRAGHDRIHLAVEREPRRLLHCPARDQAGLDRPGACRSLAGVPRTGGDAVIGRNRLDLFPRTQQGDFGVDAVGQRRGHDLRPNPARITQGDGEPGPPGHGQRMST